jgi:ribosomal protein S18 acetylase RimI-like enzyme
MNSFDLGIRDCRRSDLDNICKIEEICHGSAEAIRRVAFTQYFDLFAPAFVLAETSSQAIGFAVGGLALGDHVRLAWLLDVAILPAFQGCGAGYTISRRVLDRLIKGGAARIQATVAPGNDRSLKMLTRLGFHTIDDIPEYFGSGQRRFLMELRCEV